jgi:hypothetical protein
MFYHFAELGFDYSKYQNAEGKWGKNDYSITSELGADYDCKMQAKYRPESWLKLGHCRMAAFQKVGQTIQLRTRIMPEVFEGNPTAQDLAHGKALRSVIWGEGVNRVFVVSNVSSDPQEFTLPTGTSNWYDYLANNPNALASGTKVTLKAGEVKVYTAQYFQLPEVPTKYVFDDYVNIEDVEFKSSCVIYPTISEDIVFIEIQEDIKSVELINLQGQKVMTTGSTNSINISALPQGLYMIIINLNNTQEAHKIYRK